MGPYILSNAVGGGRAADPDTDRVVLHSDGGRPVSAGRNYAEDEGSDIEEALWWPSSS